MKKDRNTEAVGKRCLIVTGGRVSQTFLRRHLKKETYDWIAAADHGLDACVRAGILPDLLVGDLDSVSGEALKEMRREQGRIRIERLNPMKDDSDTEHALLLAMDEGMEDITILGAFGSRIDHMLANIRLLHAPLKRGVACRLLDERNCVTLHDRGFTRRREAYYGSYVSFLPFSDVVKGLTLQGFLYPLKDKEYSRYQDYSLGVSNQICDDVTQVSFTEGMLLMIESRD